MIMAVRNEDDIHVIIMLLVKLMTDDNYSHASGDQDGVDEDDDDQLINVFAKSIMTKFIACAPM